MFLRFLCINLEWFLFAPVYDILNRVLTIAFGTAVWRRAMWRNVLLIWWTSAPGMLRNWFHERNSTPLRISRAVLECIWRLQSALLKTPEAPPDIDAYSRLAIAVLPGGSLSGCQGLSICHPECRGYMRRQRTHISEILHHCHQFAVLLLLVAFGM